MRKYLAVFGIVALAVSAWAAQMAIGRGVIRTGDDSRGVFKFIVAKSGDDVRGTLEFKQVRRGSDRPVAVVLLAPVRGVTFGDHTAEFGGPGSLNGRPVLAHVRAFDGGDSHDAFAIECKSGDGRVVFAAVGELVEGGIEVGQH